jgi:hypothetical protein
MHGVYAMYRKETNKQEAQMKKKITTKKKQGGISGKPSIMRRNKILLAMAIRALELGSTVDAGKNDPYIDGMLAGISECVNIVKDYGA